MKPAIIIIGMGEMGGVFARAFLRAGYPVHPVLRGQPLAEVAQQVKQPTLVLVAVAEADLNNTLANIPATWKSRLVLLQNELLPHDWQRHEIANPSVISVWFEKKSGQDVKVIIPSPVYGQQAELIHAALNTLDIPSQIVASETEMLFELVRKNVYILTTNCAGLITGGNVASLWQQHRSLAEQVANDVIDIQEWLTQQHFDRPVLIEAMVSAFEGDPEHRCMGRSAPSRLAKAVQQADVAKLAIPTLRKISAETQAQ